MTDPLLTIVIPTYNRDVWLENSLKIINEEIQDLNWIIEIIVSNNASVDNTELVVEKYKKLFPLVYNCNSQNIGAIRNISKCLELASGRYVWVLGDDDFLIKDFLKKMIFIIKDNKIIPFFFIDMVVWNPIREYGYGDCIEYRDSIDDKFFNINKIDFVAHSELKEIATFEKGYFNAISNFILLKEDYLKAFKIGVDAGEEFTSIESTFPHSYYMAKYLMNKPCIAITTHGLICSNKVSWKKYYEITWLKWYPELIILMVKNGADKSDALNGRKILIKNKYGSMIPKLFNGGVSNYEYFSWNKFVKDNFYIKEFWVVIYRILKKTFKESLQ
ncbi:glycosyltransferase family 2 protein [Flavobacterium sp. 83]|uniref:glycosyltransferase family 2 protein n=1 Tax=Flavobacterium sp. 83 TaxID=1131812 RepID=UPI000689752D|nr:glycosyltransferase family 2 protein [Flavobacterium sp. 83]